jgi:hypothetical protein
MAMCLGIFPIRPASINSRNPMKEPMKSVPFPAGKRSASGALKPICSHTSYAKVFVP